MTRKPALPLASLTAIAAALTFTATPSLAQDTAVTPPADIQTTIPESSAAPATAPAPALPEISAEPAAPAAPAPTQTFAPSTPVVQATSEAPEEASPPPAPRAVRQPVANATENASPRTAAPEPATSSAAPPAPATTTRPTAPKPLVDMRSQSAPEAVPAPSAEPARSRAPDSLAETSTAYVLIGGGVFLVLGTGAMVFALSRRRRPVDATIVPSATATPSVSAPPVEEAARPLGAPADAPAAMARAATARNSAWPQLEEMVAAQPDAANPFLTRRKRMRRAKFLLEHGNAPAPLTSGSAAAAAAAPARQPAVTVQPAKPRPSYTFGGTAAPRQNWKPITT